MFNSGIGNFKVPYKIPNGAKKKKAAPKKAAPVQSFTYPGIGRAFTPTEQEANRQSTGYYSRQPQAQQQQQSIQPAYDPVAAAQAQAAAAEAARIAEEQAKLNKYRGQGLSTLDEMTRMYDELMGLVRTTGADQSTRINKNYDEKVGTQIDDMHNGMYDVDAGAAASNLADSSFRSFDRGKVRKAADSNIKTLNTSREGDLGTLGKQIESEIARFNADKEGIGLTRQLLNDSTDVNEVMSTAHKLDGTKRGLGASKANYGPQGQFAQKASALGNYDTTALEASLKSVVDNASASPASKQATVNDLLNGTSLDDKKKNELKNKYTQTIG